ncbi:hypothetical protein [Kordiimonas sediminis]|uniref:hypothetical protein n=1 Tax=Kordiimonas sediminis TaxID=1735581 RepID=UPI001747E041|nr:hypothetical protein [Kordiimonas sediminis]
MAWFRQTAQTTLRRILLWLVVSACLVSPVSTASESFMVMPEAVAEMQMQVDNAVSDHCAEMQQEVLADDDMDCCGTADCTCVCITAFAALPLYTPLHDRSLVLRRLQRLGGQVATDQFSPSVIHPPIIVS